MRFEQRCKQKFCAFVELIGALKVRLAHYVFASDQCGAPPTTNKERKQTLNSRPRACAGPGVKCEVPQSSAYDIFQQ